MPGDIKHVTGGIVPPSELASRQHQPGTGTGVRSDLSPGAHGDTVSLTDAAAALRRAEEALSRTPVVEPQRVDTVRQALAEGRYQVNPARVADKFVQFELLLNDMPKPD